MASEFENEQENVVDDSIYDMSDEELEALVKAQRNGGGATTSDDDSQEDEESEEDVDVEDDTQLEVEDDTEQPDSDSGTEADESDLDAEDEPTEDSDENEDVDTSEDDNKVTVDTEPKKHVYKANGQTFEFTDDEIKAQFGTVFGKAMDYTRKMQEISPWRKTISALTDNGLSHQDVSLMIDVLKGDKDAIATVLKNAKIDPVDLDIEQSKYTPRSYGKSEDQLAIEDVVGVISRDPEYKVTKHVVDVQWDDASRAEMRKNPNYINDLHIDIKSGVFDKVAPMATKLKVYDGGRKSDIEYYMEAGRAYYADLERQRIAEEAKRREVSVQKPVNKENEKLLQVAKQAEERKAKQEAIKKAAPARKAAAPTKSAAGNKIVDYLEEISEEDFEKWYKKLQESY